LVVVVVVLDDVEEVMVGVGVAVGEEVMEGEGMMGVGVLEAVMKGAEEIDGVAAANTFAESLRFEGDD
jgi:hypothetical protein